MQETASASGALEKINGVGVQGAYFPLYTDAKETGYPENT